jgi:hypothetical protein
LVVSLPDPWSGGQAVRAPVQRRLP